MVARFEQAVDRWIDAWAADRDSPCLELHPLADNRGLIEDTRGVAERRWQRIDEDAISVLSALHDPVRREHIERRIDAGLVDRVEELVERKLVACYEGRYMSLACEPLIGKRLTEKRRQRLQASGPEHCQSALVDGTALQLGLDGCRQK